MKKPGKIKLLAYFCSIISFLLIWILLTAIINAPLILPGPYEVLVTFLKLIQTPLFWKAFLYTFLRVIASFVISITAGTVCGYFCSESDFLKCFLEIPLTIIRSTPVIALILITLFWFTSDWVPVFSGFLMTFPVMVDAVTTGFSVKNQKLYTMAECYNFSKKEIFRYIKIPACKNYFLTGADTVFGLSWKVVAAGEVLCIPKYACGTLMQKAQVYLETAQVIGVTVMLIISSFTVKKLVRLLFTGVKAYD